MLGVLLRGRLFTVGDRIVMGGVRGDVVALGFMQTTVMEMGETPAEQGDSPSQWVHARQYTGRLVRITNDRIFEKPVYNYTREFPYLWEEMRLPVPYDADHARAERILLEAARRHTAHIQAESEPALRALERHYPLKEPTGVAPKVYWRLTDNWLELTVRFVVEETGIRALKDAMSREILSELDAAGIQVASSTFEVVGIPPVRIEDGDHGSRSEKNAPTAPPAEARAQRPEAPRAD